MVTLTKNSLPDQLLRLSQPPSRLFASADNLNELMRLPRLAIIGSRKITPYGRAVTSKFASDLAARGVVIVSGLALGVDSVAHSSCLDVGGTTIAVLPTGLDKIYPVTHTQLVHKIHKSNGLLVTEYPERTEPMRQNFIARNRIIAGLAEAVLITEAALKSGSLHTANFALELGIPVLAVPGNITSSQSEGCNNLIKSGATPVTSVDDICRALNWTLDESVKGEVFAANENERIILSLLRRGISDGQQLLLHSELDAAPFNQSLTMLEITGRIRPLGANHWSLT